MKTTLTPEQSAKLIAKGISADKASEIKEYDDEVSKWTHRGSPIFTLADILGLLPKEIVNDTIMCENDDCPISIRWDKNCKKWFIGYDLVPHPVGVVDSELIDALFSTLCWDIDRGHIDLTK